MVILLLVLLRLLCKSCQRTLSLALQRKFVPQKRVQRYAFYTHNPNLSAKKMHISRKFSLFTTYTLPHTLYYLYARTNPLYGNTSDQMLFHYGWITCCHTIIWNITYNHRSCGDNTSSANPYTWAHGNISTKPGILTY